MREPEKRGDGKMKKLIIKTKYILSKDEELKMANHFKALQNMFSAFSNPMDVAKLLPKKMREKVENMKTDEGALSELMKAVVTGITLEDGKREEKLYELRFAVHPFPDALIDKVLDAVGSKAKRQFRFIESVARE